MQTHYFLVGTYRHNSRAVIAHTKEHLVAHHDGNPLNEAESIRTAIAKLEQEIKTNFHNSGHITNAEYDLFHWAAISITPISSEGSDRAFEVERNTRF